MVFQTTSSKRSWELQQQPATGPQSEKSPRHLTTPELEAGLDAIRQSPKDGGTLALIARRPRVNVREVLQMGDLSLTEGLVGDTWNIRASRRTGDGTAHPEMQLNIMNARAAALVAQDKDRWALAGDQLY